MSTILMVIAVVCLTLATLFLAGVAQVEHPLAWLSAGLTFWALAVLIGGAGPIIERVRQRES
jgi:hypothetical protein